MARISLVPQKREFFDLSNRSATNIIATAEALVGLLDSFPDAADERMRDIKELEHEGDRTTHELVDLINRTFVTPFDRDDMDRLAGVLDDVCDHVDDSAEKIVGHGLTEVRDQARQQAPVIHRCATTLAEAIGRLEGFEDSRRQLIELRTLEDEGDRRRAKRSRSCSRGIPTPCRSCAGRTSTSSSKRRSTPVRTPRTSSRRSS